MEARKRRRLPPPAARRMLREKAGVTQEAIARELGVTRVTVCRWETGIRTPRGPHLSAYLRVLEQLAREGLAA